jgi:hypothetical protein
MTRAYLALALATLALDAQAVGRLADVEIVDRATGAVLEPHYRRGEYWVAGQPGARYSISIRNQLGERLLAVTSVDGVNVVSGETAAFQQTGYVFGPYQAYEICGWRKSDQDVAGFVFTLPPDSYAARTGRPANVGVVGIALFRESRSAPPLLGMQSPPEPAPPPGARRALAEQAAGDRARAKSAAAATPLTELPNVAAPPPPAATVTAPRPALGTGHGAREASYVERTDFNRQGEIPNEVIRIRYDSYANLVAMGVIGARPPPPRPNAFPDSPARYVPDPPGYPADGLR